MDKDNRRGGFFRTKKFKTIIIVVAALIIIRLILPYVILHYANRSLQTMNGYYGHIEDIDLAIYRGAYKIKNMYLNKVDSVSGQETEFFDSKVIDLSVEWQALWKGRLVGELEFESPSLRFTKDKAELGQVRKDTNDFRKIIKDFMPLKINRFEVNQGTIRYIDQSSKPKVDLKMEDTHILAENLGNIKGGELLPSKVTASASLYEGQLNFNMNLDALAKEPTFDMNTELKNTNLTKINDFFKAYGKFDVHSGIFGLYMEGASKEGQFVGYVKPIIKHLDVIGPEDKEDNLLQKFWEGVVAGLGLIFKNQRHDQVATKIPLEGRYDKTNPNIWMAIVDILRNAFVRALQPSIDHEINIASVDKAEEDKTGLEKIGEKIGVEKKNGEEKKDEEKKPGILKKLFNKDKEENKKEDGKKEK